MYEWCPRVPAREPGFLESHTVKPMSTTTLTTKESNGAPTALAIEKRTRRACVESMVVHPHGGGSGMFDVYNVRGEMYTVDLRDGVCSCPDFVHRESSGGCKHIRRVRLEFGIEDVPAAIHAERSSPTDVELARRRRGIGVEPEPEPEQVESVAIEVNSQLGEVEQAARHAVAMTDGGTVVSSADPRSRTETTGAPTATPTAKAQTPTVSGPCCAGTAGRRGPDARA